MVTHLPLHRGLAFITTVFTLVLLLPTTALASSELTVSVVDEDGDALAGADVTFLELNKEVTTDESGRLMLKDVFRGTHTVLIEVDDREPKWAEIDIGSETSQETQFVVPSTARQLTEPVSSEGVELRTTSASPLSNPVDYQPLQTLDKLELQKRSANSYGQMLDGSPGVAARSFGPAPSRPVIRGLGGERVLVLQNGERTGDVSSTAHDHHIAIDPLEAERVDIVRGPASLLYGSSALGGVVNIMDERIPKEWGDGLFSEAALYGATGQTTGAAAASAGYGFESAAVRGRVSQRLAGDMQTPDGVMPDTSIQGTTADIGGSTRTANGLYGASLGFQNLTFGLPEAIDDPDESVELRSQRFFAQTHAERQLDGFFESMEWRILANHYGHDEIEIEPGPDGILEEELELGYDILAASTSLTLPHGEVGPVDRGALGVQLRARQLALSGDEILSPDSREGAAAIYIFEEIPVGQIVRLQFGIRPELHIIEPRANDSFDAPDERLHSPTLSGSMGVHLQPASNLEAGAQLARAHRAPIIEELYSDAAHLGTGQYEIGDPTLQNEIGHGVDAFIRFSTDILETEFSAFYNHITDFIFLEPTGEEDAASGYPIHQYQGADARLIGAESALKIRPWRDLELRSTVDVVRGQRLSPTVENLPAIPPLRGRFEGGWNAADYWAMTRVRSAASQSMTAPAETGTSGYALLDLEGGLRLHRSGAHHLSMRFANIFDTAYQDHLSRVRGLTAPMPGRALHATYRWTY